MLKSKPVSDKLIPIKMTKHKNGKSLASPFYYITLKI